MDESNQEETVMDDKALKPRKDAKRDEDGDCSVCGLRWPDPRDTLEPHICPPGFLSDS